MNRVKEVDIKNRIYYFFDEMINKKILDPKKVKLKSHTKVFLFTNLATLKSLTMEKLIL